ncbi:hypothetical protein SAY86_009184 [Trapa natans]|uniref:Uncharacterized protein n=1 Tax=Trapa natans TaxID=22666 RepID=A0AAN7KG28_TRANT|nr:hypothetical protein SAY86_009184 [Trapa natans]
MIAFQRRLDKLGNLWEERRAEKIKRKATGESLSKGQHFAAGNGCDSEVSDRKESGGRACSGHCKAVVWRVVEQVRAETEQWSQMQELLGQMRDEMEELHAARDFWVDHVGSSDWQNQSL